MPPAGNSIICGDCASVLPTLPDESARLIYIDPPFNTGKTQTLNRIKVVADAVNGDRVGFGGRAYRSIRIGSQGYDDTFDGYIDFLAPLLAEARRILTSDGSLFFHIDQRESHYCRLLLDSIFGVESFMNEIIWAYDFGGRSKRKWAAKHDSIFWYAKDPNQYVFNADVANSLDYPMPGDAAEFARPPIDVWWNTIVPTNGKERTGYPTQKPLAILKRLIAVHSDPGDHILDFFAGSGTTGEAAARLERCFTMIDVNYDAATTMSTRLAFASPTFQGFAPDIRAEDALQLALET